MLVSMSAPQKDWAAVMDRLLEGDRLALLEVSRLINGFLTRWNAFDFRDEWDDLIQEVVLATGRALREGRIRDRAAIVGFLRTTTRFKFVDRLKVHLRCHEDETLPWEDVVESSLEPVSDDDPSGELQREMRRALDSLPEQKRRVVLAIHVEGKTYEEAARDTEIPLGSLKRYLRDGLAQLREELGHLMEDTS